MTTRFDTTPDWGIFGGDHKWGRYSDGVAQCENCGRFTDGWAIGAGPVVMARNAKCPKSKRRKRER